MNKCDVWIRTYEKQVDNVRRGFAIATIARWALEPVNIRLIEASQFGITEGRALAEKDSQSDPYIFTDDDVLIVGKNWVERAVHIFNEGAWLCYGAVSTLSLVETENTAVPPQGSGDIFSMHWVGAPMIIRKGILDFTLCWSCGEPRKIAGPILADCAKCERSEMTLGSECGDMHRQMEKKGYKQGLINPTLRLRHLHMGHGFSSNPNLHWGF